MAEDGMPPEGWSGARPSDPNIQVTYGDFDMPETKPSMFADQIVPQADADAELAQAQGITVSDLHKRREVREESRYLKGLMERELPETFGGMYIENNPEYRIYFLFRGPDAEANKQLAVYTSNPVFVAKGVPYTEAELNDAMEVATKILHTKGIEFEGNLDIKKSKVIIYVLDPKEAKKHLRTLLRHYKFMSVEKTEGFVQTTDSFVAGDKVQGSTMLCTMGWNVFYHSDYRIGQSTAGHCDNDIRHNRTGSKLSFKGERQGGQYDLQWHQQDRREIPTETLNIFWNGSRFRQITDVIQKRDLDVGDTICKYGRTTGQTCGEIINVDASTNFKGEVGTYIKVRNANGIAMTDFGDSGGPAFTPAAGAVGIVHGKGTGSSAKDMYVMSVDRYRANGVGVIKNRFEIALHPDTRMPYDNYFRDQALTFYGKPYYPITIYLQHTECGYGHYCTDATWTVDQQNGQWANYEYRCSGWSETTRVNKFYLKMVDATGVETSDYKTVICDPTPPDPS